MTRENAILRRDKLALQFADLSSVLRGSLIQRTVHHSSGCSRCARGEGHPLWVLNVNYPGAKTRQLSLHPSQVPLVRQWLENYRRVKQTLEAISELNRSLLLLDRVEARKKEVRP
jgi:hypothetical protein